MSFDSKELEFKSSAAMTIKAGGSMKINSDADVKIEGSTIDLN